MRASNIVAATFAIGLVSAGFIGLTQGLAMPQPKSTFCQNSRLSFPDQGQCDQELSAAPTKVLKEEVMARYQSKIDATIQTQQHAATASSSNTN